MAPSTKAAAVLPWLLLALLIRPQPAKSSGQPEPATRLDASCSGLAGLCRCQQAGSSTSPDSLAALSRLDCAPADLGALTRALAALPIRVQFMQIDAQQQAPGPNPKDGLANEPDRKPVLQIEHLAIQLRLEPGGVGQQLGRQLADFLQLLDADLLQSLSIVADGEHRQENTNNDGEPLQLASLLRPLAKLTRFELSSTGRGGSWPSIGAGSFASQTRLKWLNLASNWRTEIAANEQLKLSKELEYLNFESSGLASFNLARLLASPFEPSDVSDSELAASLAATNASYLGQPNLVSLNLASNKLRSLEQDLFGGLQRDPAAHLEATRPTCADLASRGDQFVLASLTQLDLSRNLLAELSVQSGQLVQCAMPNLAQLYLQHNRLLHVNLNSLLEWPFFVADSVHQSPTEFGRSLGADYQASKLEHLDLSWNRLLAVSLVEREHPAPGQSNALRRPQRSIQLNGNYLRSPLLVVPLEWAKRLLFSESLLFGANRQPPGDLLNALDLLELPTSLGLSVWFGGNASQPASSLCDMVAGSDPGDPLQPQQQQQQQQREQQQQQQGLELQLARNGIAEIRRAHFASAKCKAIQIVRLQMNGLASIEEAAFGSLSNLEQLDLSSNSLARLAELTFAGNGRLKWLNLANNQLGSLPGSLFANLRQLEWLSLRANKLASLPASLLRGQLGLKSIDVSGNELGVAPTIATLGRPSPSLAPADHRTVQPAKRPPNVAANKPKRTRTARRQARQLQRQPATPQDQFEPPNEEQTALLLASNRLQFFELETCTSFAAQVQLVRLSSNQLTAIHATTFKCFESAQSLRLDANRLQSIDSKAFAGLKQLQHLDLSRNQLVGLDSNVLLGPSASLQQLYLASNRLVAFDLQGLSSARQLEHIDLSDNSGLRLDVGDLCSLLTQLSLIRRLDLSNLGAISTVGEQKSTALLTERLQLDSIKLSKSHQVDEFLFGFLSNHLVGIESLQLDGTDIRLGPASNRLASMLINRVQNELLDLDLAANELASQTFIASLRNRSLMVQPIQLRKLNLSHNRLKVWPFDEWATVSVLVNLQHLNLSNNKLDAFIHGDQIKPFGLAQLESLDISANRIAHLVVANSSGRASFQLAHLMPKLHFLDASRNKITALPEQFLQNSHQLAWINLSGNPLVAFPGRLIAPAGRPLGLKLSLGPDFSMPAKVFYTEHSDEQLLQQATKSELVLFRSDDKLECRTVDDFSKFQEEVEFDQVHSDFDEAPSQCETCRQLLATTDRLDIESSSLARANWLLTHLGLHKPRLVSLKLTGGKLDLSDQAADLVTLAPNLVELDLSGGGLAEFGATSPICGPDSSLMSLSLSRNKLKRLPGASLADCRLLGRLDLSHNRISSLRGGWLASALGEPAGLLLALSLGHNPIKELDNFDLEPFASLRVIDLSQTQIGGQQFGQLSLELLRRNAYLLNAALLASPRAESHYLDNAYELRTNDSMPPVSLQSHKQAAAVPQVQLEPGSLKVMIWQAHSSAPTFSLSQVQPSALKPAQITVPANQTVKFCSLKWRASIGKLCLINNNNKNNNSDNNNLSDSSGPLKCLYLRLPADEPSCLTDLRDQPVLLAGANSSLKRPETTRRSNLDTADSVIAAATGSGASDDEHQSDLVLTVIELLKIKWLQLKQFDLRSHLAALSQIRSDQIWMEINGVPIYSLGLLKLAVVGCSICILALLLIAFVQLSRNQGDNRKPTNRMAGRCSDENDRIEVDSSMSTSANSCDGSKSTRSTGGAGVSESTFSQSCTSKTTQVPRPNGAQASPTLQPPLSLDAGQLAACSTPSSSLGPSSVETGETMQAIESIHSGASGTTLVPYDCEHGGPTIATQQAQHRLATVTRMVKSSSANFDTSHLRVGNQSVGSFNHLAGRASDSEPRYSTLRSRIRAPTNQLRLRQPVHYEQVPASIGFEQPDPTTLSLMSISSALSSSSNYQNQMQHEHHQPLYGYNHNPGSSTGQLCHFHQLAAGTRLQPNDVISEQDEQQLLNNQQGYQQPQQQSEPRVDGPDFEVSETHFPPPPPTSLVIECLENEHLRYFQHRNMH